MNVALAMCNPSKGYRNLVPRILSLASFFHSLLSSVYEVGETGVRRFTDLSKAE